MNNKMILTMIVMAMPIFLSAQYKSEQELIVAQKLIRAVLSGDSVGVLQALDNGADPNTQEVMYYHPSNDEWNSYRLSMLSIAAHHGYVDIMELLLQAGANPCISVLDASTPEWVEHENEIIDCLKRYKPGLDVQTNGNPILQSFKIGNTRIYNLTVDDIITILQDYEQKTLATIHTKTYILFLGLFLSSTIADFHDLSKIEQYLQTQVRYIVENQKKIKRQQAPDMDIYDTIASIRSNFTAEEIEKIVLLQFTVPFPNALASMYVAMTEPSWFKMGMTGDETVTIK